MPSCRVTNHTGKPLNFCLKQVTALHFENGVGDDDEQEVGRHTETDRSNLARLSNLG
jgi:hypothetical protein